MNGILISILEYPICKYNTHQSLMFKNIIIGEAIDVFARLLILIVIAKDEDSSQRESY